MSVPVAGGDESFRLYRHGIRPLIEGLDGQIDLKPILFLVGWYALWALAVPYFVFICS